MELDARSQLCDLNFANTGKYSKLLGASERPINSKAFMRTLQPICTRSQRLCGWKQTEGQMSRIPFCAWSSHSSFKLHSPSAAGHLCLPQLTGTEVQGLNSHCAQGLTFKPQHDENEHKSWGKEKGACHQLWQLALNEETEKCHGSHVHRHQKICKQWRADLACASALLNKEWRPDGLHSLTT